jgi:hypothetical protein
MAPQLDFIGLATAYETSSDGARSRAPSHWGASAAFALVNGVIGIVRGCYLALHAQSSLIPPPSPPRGDAAGGGDKQGSGPRLSQSSEPQPSPSSSPGQASPVSPFRWHERVGPRAWRRVGAVPGRDLLPMTAPTRAKEHEKTKLRCDPSAEIRWSLCTQTDI